MTMKDRHVYIGTSLSNRMNRKRYRIGCVHFQLMFTQYIAQRSHLQFILIRNSLSVITSCIGRTSGTGAAKTNTCREGWASKHAQLLHVELALSTRPFVPTSKVHFRKSSQGENQSAMREFPNGGCCASYSESVRCNLGAAVGRLWVSFVFASSSVTQFSSAGATTWEDNWRWPGRHNRSRY